MSHTSTYWRLRGQEVRSLASEFKLSLRLRQALYEIAEGYDYIASQVEEQERLEGRKPKPTLRSVRLQSPWSPTQPDRQTASR